MSVLPVYFSVWVSTSLLSLVFVYLHKIHPDAFLRSGMVSWTFAALRYASLLAMALVFAPAAKPIVPDLFGLWAAVFLVESGWRFRGSPIPKAWRSFWIGYSFVILSAGLLKTSPFVSGFLDHYPEGAMQLYAGYLFLTCRRGGRVGRMTVGFTMIAWGLHKFDFPWFQAHPAWLMTGFWVTGMLTLLVGIGILLVYFEDARSTLQINEARYRALMEQAPDAIVVYDTALRRFVDANGSAETLFGSTKSELIGSDIERFYPARSPAERGIRDELEEHRSRVLAGESLFFERQILRADGTVVECEARLSFLPSEQGGLIRASYIDITDRKRSEARIRDSIREKDALLRELHHRTKNNMNLIASLIRLQTNGNGDARLLEAFEKIENRIHSMALAHDKFYDADDLSRIDFREYIIDLVAHLRVSLGVAEERVRADLRLEHVILSIDAAIPCGLILNELISNVFTHAFPENRSGAMTMEMRTGADGRCLLRIHDNGVGLPDGIDTGRRGPIGLQMVKILAEHQLKAKIEIASDAGTTVALRFKDFAANRNDPGSSPCSRL